MAEIVPGDEDIFVANDAGRFQFGCNVAGGISRPQHHKGLRSGLNWGQQRPGEPSRCAEKRKNNDPENSAHLGSLDEERSGGVADFGTEAQCLTDHPLGHGSTRIFTDQKICCRRRLDTPELADR